MEPVTIAYMIFGALWVAGAITYLQIMVGIAQFPGLGMYDEGGKFEVKQEYKDTEGNPEIKGHRRQLAQEIAYDDRPWEIEAFELEDTLYTKVKETL